MNKDRRAVIRQYNPLSEATADWTLNSHTTVTYRELDGLLDAADRAEAAEALLKERDERLRVLGLRICSQCGQSFEAPACGPTHSLIAHERAESCPSLPKAHGGNADLKRRMAAALENFQQYRIDGSWKSVDEILRLLTVEETP
jgi:hypothetical protein